MKFKKQKQIGEKAEVTGIAGMEIKKNEKFIVTIEDMSEDGAGIGKLDGYIWFVKDALIGDVIEASAMKMKKNYQHWKKN